MERIQANQKAFVQAFHKSVWSFFCRRGTLSLEEYIEKIYRYKPRNYFKAFLIQLKMLKFSWVHHWKMKKLEDRNDELVIVSIIKDEGEYIEEWIEFYRLQGIDHFYIFDNESRDHTSSILDKYKEVTRISIPGKAQIMAYNFALKALKDKTKWIAFLDADEFMFPVKEEKIKDILKEYEAYPGLGVNWVLYGPCGHEKRPEGLVIENYTQTFKDRNQEMNCRIKSIVQPKKVLCMEHPHTPIYKNGELAVNEKKEVISGTAMYAPLGTACTMTNSIERIRINHYWTKSLEELKKKCDKGRSDGSSSLLLESTLKRLEGEKMEDTEILRFLPELKERLGEVSD